MIDLSQFVDKQVRVTFRNGCISEGKVSINQEYTTQDTRPYVFEIAPSSCYSSAYTAGGFYYYSGLYASSDIIQIEEIKPMKKYEQLENQVAEMQKEIDRLKREEKNYPNLKPVEVTRTVSYTPEEFFEHCELCGEEPTEEGYLEYYSNVEENNDCFVDKSFYTQEIKKVEN